MNAYEYGMDNFSFKYQPIPNAIIFNDKYIFADDFETNEDEQRIPLDALITEYIYAEAYKLDNGTYKLYEPIRTESELYIDDYLIPNNYLTDLGDDNAVYNAEGTYQVYRFNETYYVKYRNPNSLDAVTITGSSNPKTPSLREFFLTDIKLKDLVENKELKLFFFFSNDGEKLNKAYNAITKTLPNEIIFFIEKDVLGGISSVVRVYTGSNITTETKLPANAIAHLAKRFNIDASVSEIEVQIKEVFKNHLEFVKEQKEQGVFYWVNKLLEVPLVINNGILYGIGYILKELGDGISSELTFDDKRWNYYDENGDKAKDFSPVLPGFEALLGYLGEAEKDSFNKADTFEVVVASLENKVNIFFNSASNDSNFKTLFKKYFDFIPVLIAKLKALYKVFKETFTFKNGLIFGNALFIGIVNSLIKAIGGILSLVGSILKFPYEVRQEEKERKAKFKQSTTLSSVMEVFEAFLQTLDKLFTSKNLEALFNGFIQMSGLVFSIFSNPDQIVSLSKAFTVTVADKTVEGAKYLSARIDNIGYGLGFAIGFIIEEVLTAIATGGAKTVGTALKLTVESFEQLLKLGRTGVKTIAKAPVSFAETLIGLFKYLRKLNVQKQIDDFIAWFVKLFKTIKQLAEEAYLKVFGRSTRDKFKKYGFSPTKYDEVTETFTFCPIKT